MTGKRSYSYDIAVASFSLTSRHWRLVSIAWAPPALYSADSCLAKRYDSEYEHVATMNATVGAVDRRVLQKAWSSSFYGHPDDH